MFIYRRYTNAEIIGGLTIAVPAIEYFLDNIFDTR